MWISGWAMIATCSITTPLAAMAASACVLIAAPLAAVVRNRARCVVVALEVAALYKERAACRSAGDGAYAGPTSGSASGGTRAGAVRVRRGGTGCGVVVEGSVWTKF